MDIACPRSASNQLEIQSGIANDQHLSSAKQAARITVAVGPSRTGGAFPCGQPDASAVGEVARKAIGPVRISSRPGVSYLPARFTVDERPGNRHHGPSLSIRTRSQRDSHPSGCSCPTKCLGEAGGQLPAVALTLARRQRVGPTTVRKSNQEQQREYVREFCLSQRSGPARVSNALEETNGFTSVRGEPRSREPHTRLWLVARHRCTPRCPFGV